MITQSRMRFGLSVLLSFASLLALLWAVGRSQPVAAQKVVEPDLPSLALPRVLSTVTFPPGIGFDPHFIGINPVSGYVYVVGKDATAVISGTQVITTLAAGSTTAGGLPAKHAIGVNPTTGLTYIAKNNSVAVISGTDIITTLMLPSSPNDIAVNSATGYVYLPSRRNTTSAIISGTQFITTIAVSYLEAVSVNPKTGYVYLTKPGLTLILSGTESVGTLAVGGTAVGVNPMTGYIYLADRDQGVVRVVSGTQIMATISVGAGPDAVGVNPATGYVYIANLYSDSISVLSGTQSIATLPAGCGPRNFGITAGAPYVYVANTCSFEVTIISGTTVIATTGAHPYPRTIGVHPTTKYAYVVSDQGNVVNVLSGTQHLATIPGGSYPHLAGVNPMSGYAYIANRGSNNITVLSNTEVMTTAPSGLTPVAMSVNPNTGYAYVANLDSGFVAVISGTQRDALLWVPQHVDTPLMNMVMDVNVTTGYVYVALDETYYSEVMTILSGMQVVTKFVIPGYGYPVDIAVNSVTGYAYLADFNSLTVLSGTQIISQVLMGSPSAVGVNSATGYVYVADEVGKINILSGTQVVTTLTGIDAPNGFYPKIAINERTGYVYITNPDITGTLIILSGTQLITTIPFNSSPSDVVVDPASGYVFVAVEGVTVISGTEIVETLPVFGTIALGVNPSNGLVYAAGTDYRNNYAVGSVTVIGGYGPLAPTSPTPAYLSSPTDDIVIDFGEPVITTTVHFSITPTLPITVDWVTAEPRSSSRSEAAADRAIISHLEFQENTVYTLRILAGGQTETGREILEAAFAFSVPSARVYLPLIRRT